MLLQHPQPSRTGLIVADAANSDDVVARVGMCLDPTAASRRNVLPQINRAAVAFDSARRSAPTLRDEIDGFSLVARNYVVARALCRRAPRQQQQQPSVAHHNLLRPRWRTMANFNFP